MMRQMDIKCIAKVLLRSDMTPGYAITALDLNADTSYAGSNMAVLKYIVEKVVLYPFLESLYGAVQREVPANSCPRVNSIGKSI